MKATVNLCLEKNYKASSMWVVNKELNKVFSAYYLIFVERIESVHFGFCQKACGAEAVSCV